MQAPAIRVREMGYSLDPAKSYDCYAQERITSAIGPLCVLALAAARRGDWIHQVEACHHAAGVVARVLRTAALRPKRMHFSVYGALLSSSSPPPVRLHQSLLLMPYL